MRSTKDQNTYFIASFDLEVTECFPHCRHRLLRASSDHRGLENADAPQACLGRPCVFGSKRRGIVKPDLVPVPATVEEFEVDAGAGVVEDQGSDIAVVADSEGLYAVEADLRTGGARAAVHHVARDCTEGAGLRTQKRTNCRPPFLLCRVPQAALNSTPLSVAIESH